MPDFDSYERRERDYFPNDMQYDRYVQAWESRPPVIIEETLEFWVPNREHPRGAYWAVALAAHPAFWIDLFDTLEEAETFCSHFEFKVKQKFFLEG